MPDSLGLRPASTMSTRELTGPSLTGHVLPCRFFGVLKHTSLSNRVNRNENVRNGSLSRLILHIGIRFPYMKTNAPK